jgi:hypothetical protein
MPQEKLTTRLQEIRSPEASVLLGQTIFPNQRPLRRQKVQAMAYDMQHDNFIPGTQLAFALLPDGTRYLLNGQHRLHAVIEADCPIVFEVLDMGVASLAEAKKLYKNFDVGLPRTKLDLFIADDFLDETQFGVEKIRKLNPAVALILVGFTKTQASLNSYAIVLDSIHFRM